MKTRYWFAAAVLAAAVPTIAMAQGPAAPTAPRPATTGAATGAPADGKVAVINTSIFAEQILELKAKADVVNKKYEPQFRELEGREEADHRRWRPTSRPSKRRDARCAAEAAGPVHELATSYKRRGEDLQAAYNKEADAAVLPVRQKLEDFVKDYAPRRNIILILDLPGSYNAGIIGYFNQAIDITDGLHRRVQQGEPGCRAHGRACERPSRRPLRR